MLTVTLTWIGSALGSAALSARLIRRIEWRRAGRLHADEEGAAYAVSFAIGLPIYVLLMALFIETTLVMVAKVGTMYAAFAGARSAAVWSTSLPRDVAAERPRQALVHAMAPFASGNPSHLRGLPLDEPEEPGEPVVGDHYKAGYEEYVNRAGVINPIYVRAKFQYAVAATRQFVRSTPGPGGETSVTVVYHAPLHTPVVGRWLGVRPPWNAPYRVIRIESTAVMPTESGKGKDHGIGLPYSSSNE
jgi:hypothetical protein